MASYFFLTFHGNYNNSKINIENLHESPLVMLAPLLVLSVGSIFAGILFKELFIGHELSYDFWSTSIKFLEPLSKNHPPTWFLFLTPSIVVISIPISFYLFVYNKNIVEEIVKMNKPFIYFYKINGILMNFIILFLSNLQKD